MVRLTFIVREKEITMIGGTKLGEYHRTKEMIEKILNEQGLYFVLMFLVDSNYNQEDIKAIAELFPKKVRQSTKT